MKRKEVVELLAHHANRLDRTPGASEWKGMRNEQVRGLLQLADQLQGILVSVAPDTHFRRRLHGDLILRAQEHQTGEEMTMFQQHRKGILIGAAAIGSVASVAGVIIAFVWRHRNGRTARITTG